MNFRGKPGPKQPVILPKHKANSGKTRKKLAAAKRQLAALEERQLG